uniref:Uncharacterized protein n=1 Tax=uncultured Elusimicrobia bacterium TaxID=699876 RepID=A0A650EN57_9BACT|nr:hypothetical protein Elusimicrob1349_0880 [uncultured Elusimicrobia bacterium]
MKKVLLFALALVLFPALTSAQSLEKRQLAKINAKQALKFPQDCNIEDSVIAAAKKVYEKNPKDFAAVYNYAVTLSAGECDDAEAYISSAQVKLAKRLFKEALTLKPTSPSCYAGLGYLTMYESGLSGAIFFGDNAMDDKLFPHTVKANQAAAKQALEYYKKAMQYKYDGAFLPAMKDEMQRLEKELNKLKTNSAKTAVRKGLSKKK